MSLAVYWLGCFLVGVAANCCFKTFKWSIFAATIGWAALTAFFSLGLGGIR